MKTILFVCTGNTCRSPMAAAIMKLLLEKDGITEIKAESAGIAAFDGEPASQNAQKAAEELGASLADHRAKQVERGLLAESDLVFAMTAAHAAALKAQFPEFKEKISVLGGGIPDPFGGSLDDYRRCRDSLVSELKIIADRFSLDK